MEVLMRIIIEVSEQQQISTVAQLPEEPVQIETMDGGTPSEELTQALAEASPVPAEMKGMDAGTPPEWLKEAIQGTSQPQIEGLSAGTNAGSAPNL
jgi:hypothetical protein